MWNRNCYRFPNFLIVAFTLALLCNIYLIILLWSDTPVEVAELSVKSIPAFKPKIHAIKYLNIDFIQSHLVHNQRTLGLWNVKPLKNLVKKIKRELIPKNGNYRSVLNTIAKWPTSSHLIPESAPELGDVIKYMQTAKIIRASVPKVGTQLKVMLTLEGGQKVLFKPQWYNRSFHISGSVYSGADRHNGEIVAFYLSLLLDLRRTPVAVGRRVNLKSEIFDRADPDLSTTFFKSRNETCFYGVCRYCTPEFNVCSENGLLEGALVLWLPNSVKLKSFRSPWQRTYRENKKAAWETDDTFCSKLQNQSKMFNVKENGNSRLLDLVDSSIFDFIISNGDRHHYEVIDGARNSAVLILDNGKSFGRADVDFLDILAPLYQCCKIRQTLYDRLKLLEQGSLSTLIKEITLKDAVYPLLIEPHLDAINRRLGTVLRVVELCTELNNPDQVIVS